MLVAGIDAGGSKTKCIIVDRDKNKIIAQSETGAANYQVVGLNEACRQIKLSFEQAKSKAGIEQISALGIGLAGAGRKNDIIKIRKRVNNIIGLDNIYFSDDGYIALLGATGGKEGIILIAGTGSIAYGLKKSGNKIRSGGWGPILGDEGSGFWIAMQAIKRAVRAAEDRAPKSVLEALIIDYFNFDKMEELIPFIYQNKLPRKKIAALTPEIINLAKKNKKSCVEIIKAAVKELSLLANSLVSKLDFKENKVAVAGGLINSNYFYDLLKKELKTQSDLSIYRAKYSAAYGAVFLAEEGLKANYE